MYAVLIFNPLFSCSQLVGPLSIVSTGGVIINLIISVILLIKFITVRPHSDPTDVKTSR